MRKSFQKKVEKKVMSKGSKGCFASSKGVTEHSPVKMKRREGGMGSYKSCCDMDEK